MINIILVIKKSAVKHFQKNMHNYLLKSEMRRKNNRTEQTMYSDSPAENFIQFTYNMIMFNIYLNVK